MLKKISSKTKVIFIISIALLLSSFILLLSINLIKSFFDNQIDEYTEYHIYKGSIDDLEVSDDIFTKIDTTISSKLEFDENC